MIQRFRYEGTRQGRMLRGTTFARSADHARRRLKRQKVEVDQIHSVGKGRISARDWLVFCQSMAGLLATGVPLKEAGDLWLTDADSQGPWHHIFTQVTQGTSLGEALEAQAQTPSMVIALVRMGEATGQLDLAFNKAADTLEERQKLQSAISGALAYPLVVLLVASLAIGILFIYVLPIFSDLYQRYQTDLPVLTSLLMACLDGLRAWGWLLAILLVLFAGLGWQLSQKPAIRLRIDRLILRMPLVGKHVSSYQQILFAQGLGQLLTAGIGLLEAIRITLPSLGNKEWRHRLQNCLTPIEQGASPAQTFSREHVLRDKSGHLVVLGEEAGRLAATLLDVARMEKNELDRRLAKHISMLEPLLIVGMALVIGVVLIALYLPMFDIVNLME